MVNVHVSMHVASFPGPFRPVQNIEAHLKNRRTGLGMRLSMHVTLNGMSAESIISSIISLANSSLWCRGFLWHTHHSHTTHYNRVITTDILNLLSGAYVCIHYWIDSRLAIILLQRSSYIQSIHPSGSISTVTIHLAWVPLHTPEVYKFCTGKYNIDIYFFFSPWRLTRWIFSQSSPFFPRG